MKIIKKKYRNHKQKKQLYKKIASMRKQKWAQNQPLKHEDIFKYHFSQHEQNHSDEDKSSNNKIKIETTLMQKVRNRMAAESSREKKRSYVEELQRKIIEYEELLETKQCVHCHKRPFQRQEIQITEQNEKILKKSESYLQQNVIRIDNKDAVSPFALFFVICLVITIAIFSYGEDNLKNQKRVLLNKYQILTKQLTEIKNFSAQMPPKLQSKIDQYLALLSSDTNLNSNNLHQQIQENQQNVESSVNHKQLIADDNKSECLSPSYTVSQFQLPEDDYFFKVSLFEDDGKLIQTSISSPNFQHNRLKSNNWKKMDVKVCIQKQRMMI